MTYIQTEPTYNQFLREDYGTNYPKYIAYNISASATVASTDWVITKFVWTGETQCKRETLTGSWTLKEGLAWTI